MLDQKLFQDVFKRIDETDKALKSSILATHNTFSEVQELLVSMRAEIDALTKKYEDFKTEFRAFTGSQNVDNAPLEKED